MLSGRRALDKNRPSGEHNLVEWARPYLTNKRRIFRILDARLGGQYSLAGAQKAAALALQCLSGDSRNRPSMEQVVAALEQLQDAKETGGSQLQRKLSSRGLNSNGHWSRSKYPEAAPNGKSVHPRRRLSASPLRE
uniref:Protein kinase domain-containing protein n=1 Tax=Arundo donax TaxID=35708 RepID=A0A0A9D0P6_ARUDO